MLKMNKKSALQLTERTEKANPLIVATQALPYPWYEQREKTPFAKVFSHG